MKSNFISLNQLSICINKKEILRAHSESIDQGQMVAIIGANGTGKTTLLKILAGLLTPAAGTVQIDECSYTKPKEAAYLRSIIGYAKDNPPLYPQDTIQSYMQFMAELKGIARGQIKSQIDACLEVFDLDPIRHNYIYTLSNGMQQRVNLAQAMLNNPKVLILDEPINGLDSTQCIKFRDYLLKLQKSKVTIIYASHTYSDLLAISDYMLKIEQTKLDKILLPSRIPRETKIYDYADHTT